MDESIKFEQIQDYLNGELTGTSLSDFEAQIKSDPALKAEVDLHRDIDLALIDNGNIPFVQTLNGIHEKQKETEKKPVEEVAPVSRRRILRYALAAAAAVLLAVFALPFLFPTSTSQTALQLSESSIGDTPLLDTQRSGTDDIGVTKSIADINQKLIKKQYTESIPLLEDLYSRTNDNSDALSLGYCHLQVKNHDNAITVLKKVSTKNSNVKDTAMWYLAHSYLRKGDKTTAIDILKQLIIAPTTTLKQREQAKKLVHSMENIN